MVNADNQRRISAHLIYILLMLKIKNTLTLTSEDIYILHVDFYECGFTQQGFYLYLFINI